MWSIKTQRLDTYTEDEILTAENIKEICENKNLSPDKSSKNIREYPSYKTEIRVIPKT